MEAVHVNDKGMKELAAEAKAMEAAGDTKSAIRLYTKLSRLRPSDTGVYHRLAILYRKEEDYANEMQVIDKAIAALQKIYTRTADANSTVKKISARINRAFGMVDRKGNPLFDPEPVIKWKRRKMIVAKKMKSKTL
jgi:tetratricopeptide (TPR) repeat protein